ncbi:MAG TPA: ABC transporter permease [Candidatus Nanoarchaeia archaeon]|nr:ABC transporter permease [Candidatus Nanoarchaeia archaeon]
MILEYLRVAWKNIKNRKLRVFLTLVGILISVATIFTLISVSLGLQVAVAEQFRLLGTDKLFIQPKGQLAGPGTEGAVELTEADAKVIEKVIGVKGLSLWTGSSAKVTLSGETRYTFVVGIDTKSSDLFIETGAYKAQSGRVIREGDSGNVMIGSQYKDNNFLGKEVQIGERILINDQREFQVKGILKTVGNPQDDRLIYMPLEDFRSLFNIPNRIDTMIVQVADEEELRVVAARVEKKLMNHRGVDEDTLDFTILTPEELLKSFGNVLNVITAFLLGVAAISLIIGGIGIANTMYTSVLERTKEIGVMKAIGAENNHILLMFLTESGLLGLFGGIIGVAFGMAIAKIIEFIAVEQLGTTLLRAVIPWYLILGSLLFAFLIGAISGFWPAYRAVRIKPVEALRQE